MKELSPAFRLLRKQGFDARQRFKCCSGCAGSAIGEEYRVKILADKTPTKKGFIYFHKQDLPDTDKLRRHFYEKTDVYMYLRYGPVEVTVAVGRPEVVIGLPIAEVGKALCEALKATNIPYEWDGDTNHGIKVFPFGRKDLRSAA